MKIKFGCLNCKTTIIEDKSEQEIRDQSETYCPYCNEVMVAVATITQEATDEKRD